MISKVWSSAYQGIRGVPVIVEVDCADGLPGFSMVGLPDNAVRESRERVISALRGCGFRPLGKRVTVNLAPAGIRKEGAAFDLAMAVGLLLASEQLEWSDASQWMVLGELSLDGLIRPVRGALSAAFAARSAGLGLVIPEENEEEVRLIPDIRYVSVATLEDCVRWIRTGEIRETRTRIRVVKEISHAALDFSAVHGLSLVRRVLEIAAAGQHNFLLVGPPGCGKTFCARCVPSIMPDLSENERMEQVMIRSCAGMMSDFDPGSRIRPFRAPHHSCTVAALIGGGRSLRPGEVSLAHHGVLFLDELPEFSRNCLESLRQPLEEGMVVLARASDVVEWPARFLLGAAMNPCPCGYDGDPERVCRCSPQEVSRYRNRISGPLLDRIDLRIRVPRQGLEAFSGSGGESSAIIRQRVLEARSRQYRRGGGAWRANGCLNAAETRDYCRLDGATEQFLNQAIARLGLSVRGIYRIVRVARTIADLRGAERLVLDDIAEALQYRGI